MTATAIPTGFPLDLRNVPHTSAGSYWTSKGAALATLATLRKAGRNVGGDVETHRARVPLAHVWMLGRPDHYNGVTYLMAADGSWVPGRLYDAAPCCCAPACRPGGMSHLAPWAPLALPVQPATFAHVTRTVPYHDRPERYRTKSNGSCGRWVRGDDSVALCTCGWSSYTSTRAEAQHTARAHRTNPRPADALEATQ